MSLLRRIFRPAPVEEKRSAAMMVQPLGPGRPAWKPRNYNSFALEGYKYNVIGASAVRRIASAVSAIEWEVVDGDRVLDNHPILDLLRRPNPEQTGAEWWAERISFLMLDGNLYDEVVMNERRRAQPTELWPLRPDRMEIQPGKGGIPSAYIYKIGENERRFPVNPATGESRILHTKLFNPLDDWYGMSPIQSAAYAINQHNESMSWMQALLENSARPSGVMVHSDSEHSLSDEEFRRIKNEIETHYAGAGNAGRPMLLEGGLDWKPMGLSPVDMEILRLREAAARDISLAFGVPPLLLNIPGDNTYANYREARLGFYEDTVLPLVTSIGASMSNWLGPYFDGVEIRPNKDKIEAIAEKRQRMWEMVDASMELTVNEARTAKGYDPLPEPMGSMLLAELKRSPSKQPGSPDEGADVTEDLANVLR